MICCIVAIQPSFSSCSLWSKYDSSDLSFFLCWDCIGFNFQVQTKCQLIMANHSELKFKCKYLEWNVNVPRFFHDYGNLCKHLFQKYRNCLDFVDIKGVFACFVESSGSLSTCLCISLMILIICSFWTVLSLWKTGKYMVYAPKYPVHSLESQFLV